MNQFLMVLLIFLICTCIAYTLPTSTESPKVYNCSSEEAEDYEAVYETFELSFFVNILLRKIKLLSISCEQFIKSKSNSTCKLVNSEKEIEYDNLCAKMIFMVNEFSDCEEVLKKDNSTCYNNHSMNKKTKANMTDVFYCNNLFGEGNCMRKLVIDKCGEKQWQGLKKVFSTADPKCDFSQL